MALTRFHQFKKQILDSGIKSSLLIGFILSFLGVLLSFPGTNLPLEGSVYDLMLEKRQKVHSDQPTNRIVIIAIDDLTLNNPHESHPELFSPAVYSDILEALILSGAKAVALYRSLPRSASRYYTLQEESRWFKAIESAKKNGLKIIYGFRYLPDGPAWPAQKFIDLMGRDYLGFINMIHDRDDKIRRLELFWNGPNEEANTRPLAYLAAQAMEPDLKLDDASFYIDFHDSFPKFSFGDVHQKAKEGQVDFFKRYFAGSLVIIGEASATNLDAHPVPLSTYDPIARGWTLMPSVEIQAQAIQTLLNHKITIVPKPLWLASFFMLLVILALLPMILRSFGKPDLIAWFPTLILILYPLAAYTAFQNYLFLPVVPGLVILIMVHIIFWGQRLRKNQQRQHTSSQALNLYLNPALASQIIEHPEILIRKGEKRFVTIFFADLVGFTAMAEKMNSDVLVDTLNRYYDTMTMAIERYDGFVDKFVGDAIMAIWGAPLNAPRHAVAACLAAIMQKKLMDQLNRELNQAGRPSLNALMGLNTGQVIAGNIGSKNRFNYTVLGDPVNLASRLVSVNKAYRTTILASEATQAEAKDQIAFRCLDRIRVPGRESPIKIYEVLAPIQDLSTEKAQLINYFERGLRHYWEQDFSGAIKRFEAALKIDPEDLAAHAFIERCRNSITTPPPDNWDGVTNLDFGHTIKERIF